MGGQGGKEAAPPAAQAPSLQEASATLESRIKDLELKINKADEEAKQWISKKESNPSAKARAMQVLKRKKLYEQQREQLVGTQFNLESLAFQQDSAEVTVTAVSAMTQATADLKRHKDKINMASVDKIMDELQDVQDEMKDVQEALARPIGGVAEDDEDLEAEFARLQEEETMKVLMGGGASSSALPAAAPALPASGYPAAVAASARPVAAAPAALPT